jgi:hypothetical protein
MEALLVVLLLGIMAFVAYRVAGQRSVNAGRACPPR